jgi:D-alanyl-lipoteichoic acid acyltransferase DltB (MBOAT superfamily)
MTALGEIFDSIGQLLRYDPRAPLLFSSGLFLFLFAGFTFFYRFMRERVSLRVVYVLLFSLYFYYKSSGIYFLLLLFVATTDYFIARQMERTERDGARRWLVALSVAINLGMLGYFKYTDFLIGIVNNLSGRDVFEFRNIFLPVGISFFVFQSMSYTIDIYRRRIEPLRNWLDYAFYLSFFPQLVAGPIVRARDFIPQIRQRPLVVTREMFGTGVFLIAVGLFKKTVISDYISLNFVDRIFDNPLLYSGFENLMGVVGYAMQIYCDFSGYSDMAIGLALLLGFRFPRNFDSPYKAATITEFWRRWHISLSSWLKDYLYISLGGNRKGNVRTYINLLITMLLGGLWHGAAMRFVLWGGIHGVALAVHKAMLPLFPHPTGATMRRPMRVLGIATTFIIVCFGWVFFRAPSMEVAGQVLSQIFTRMRLDLAWSVVSGYGAVFGLLVLGYAMHFTPDRVKDAIRRRVSALPLWGMALLIASVIWFVMQIKSSEIQPFIYFQF